MDRERCDLLPFLFISEADANIQEAIQQRALRTLKQKRMYEAQLAQLTQQTFNIESTALATENLRNTMVTLDAMSQANKELRKQYGKIDIGKIEVRPFRGADGGHRHPNERARG